VLTKATFMHPRYFELYSAPAYAPIRRMVERERNCEDFAMQFLVTNASSRPPVFVPGCRLDLGEAAGRVAISAGNSHAEKRRRCVLTLLRFFNRSSTILRANYIGAGGS